VEDRVSTQSGSKGSDGGTRTGRVHGKKRLKKGWVGQKHKGTKRHIKGGGKHGERHPPQRLRTSRRLGGKPKKGGNCEGKKGTTQEGALLLTRGKKKEGTVKGGGGERGWTWGKSTYEDSREEKETWTRGKWMTS